MSYRGKAEDQSFGSSLDWRHQHRPLDPFFVPRGYVRHQVCEHTELLDPGCAPQVGDDLVLVMAACLAMVEVPSQSHRPCAAPSFSP